MRSLAFILAVLPLASAQATDLCWVDHVEKQGDGILAYFPEGRIVALYRHQANDRVYYRISRTPQPQSHETATVAPAVPAALGDGLFSSNTPEDSCTLTVILENGQIGLEAKANFTPPGLAPQHVRQFIAAK